VIVWLNGPFGIGKSTTAVALVRRLPDAMLYDPEIVGAALRRIIGPVDPADDYQDLPPWVPLVAETARQLRGAYGRTLVMPMTVWRRERAERLAESLGRADPELCCFRLTAPAEVLRARIAGRAEGEGTQAWCRRHFEAGLVLMGDLAFGEAVATEGRSPDDVAAEIAERVLRGA
jgi:hypothetical protein